MAPAFDFGEVGIAQPFEQGDALETRYGQLGLLRLPPSEYGSPKMSQSTFNLCAALPFHRAAKRL
jgi:hypothetical protein